MEMSSDIVGNNPKVVLFSVLWRNTLIVSSDLCIYVLDQQETKYRGFWAKTIGNYV